MLHLSHSFVLEVLLMTSLAAAGEQIASEGRHRSTPRGNSSDISDVEVEVEMEGGDVVRFNVLAELWFGVV